MSGRRWPFLLTLGAILVVEVLMFSLNMGPEPMLVAAVGAFAGATVWCLYSLSDSTPTAPPTPRAIAAPRAPGADHQVKALRTGILFSRSMTGHGERLHDTLVDVIDDQLIHTHGVDRAAEPATAASILGTKLTAFVNASEPGASVSDTKELARIVTLIEQI